MHSVNLGKSGIRCSAIGLGCMGMSEFYGERDDAQSLRTLDRALELGVTLYDTSNAYGRGHNEELVGRFLKGRRDRVVLATKFGIVRDPDGPEGSTYDRAVDNSPAYMRQCLEESLVRLGTDRVDLYYVHRADPTVPIEDTVGALSRLVEEGKIRAIGLSEVWPETLRRAQKVHPIAALQSEYSLWTREPELEVLPTCRELGIGFVAYSPLGRGFLTDAKVEVGAHNDIRQASPRFRGENVARNRRLVEVVSAVAGRRGCSTGQVALAWLLARDVVPIPGTKRIAYLEDNVGAAAVTLSAEDEAELAAAFAIGAAAGERYDPSFAGNAQAPRA
ncbi:aldo/keto reductase [Novosphingobium album (ex Liu et al. 2023)]|uniref:Aldo/keto reductase n=1 Tax=Novosphingobium album (ex Liu et al. 2023) TaxID=3031130 RepID=A0ABT5WXC6_9SPHN|nr:aldo/keto reductase [Novosphingobium album (ex Liu et al. 2023)]MDE8654529.1 aldo/keto reductase [Novosphingobium album (ex Liu et al. 2023)]